MANNRMWLKHLPSNRRFIIAKRMGGAWYGTFNIHEKMNGFFDECFESFPLKQDDFILEFEDKPNVSED